MKPRLFTPGPTPVPEEIMLRMAEPLIHHRTEEFQQILRDASEGLQYLFCTTQPVMTLAASGTGAMEAAIVNTLSAGDEIITVNCGKFGERWGKIAAAYGLQYHEIEIEWGTAVTTEQILEQLEHYPATKAICLTHSETSTGVFTDIKAIAETLRKSYDGLIIVDGITSVGALEMRFDEWDIDIVATGSQKGLMIPPGLAFIALSERAWNAAQTSTLSSFYFDLKKARKSLEKNSTPYTPAITLVKGLADSLRIIRKEGIENVWKRHARLAHALRKGVQALGLELFAASPSNALTSVMLPEGKGQEVVRLMKEDYNITIAGGQEALKGKICRISHLGYYDEGDMLTVLHALDGVLTKIGFEHTQGSGVLAAERIFQEEAMAV